MCGKTTQFSDLYYFVVRCTEFVMKLGRQLQIDHVLSHMHPIHILRIYSYFEIYYCHVFMAP
jgi:hypothetical protein